MVPLCIYKGVLSPIAVFYNTYSLATHETFKCNTYNFPTPHSQDYGNVRESIIILWSHDVSENTGGMQQKLTIVDKSKHYKKNICISKQ